MIGFVHGILHTRCFGCALCYLFVIIWYILLYMCMNKYLKWWSVDGEGKKILSISCRWEFQSRDKQDALELLNYMTFTLIVNLDGVFNYSCVISKENFWVVKAPESLTASTKSKFDARRIFLLLIVVQYFVVSKGVEQEVNVISHWSCNYVFISPCPNSMRDEDLNVFHPKSSHQKISQTINAS